MVVVRRGVYGLGHAELRRQGHVLGAVLAVGDDAVLSHRSAARQWGLRPWSRTFFEFDPVGPGSQAAARSARASLTHLHPWEIGEDEGLPLTTPARTLLDLAAVVPPHQLRRAVERAEQLEIYDHAAVLRVLAAHPGRPAPRRSRRCSPTCTSTARRR